MELKGKRVSIYYDDKSAYNKISKKDGILIEDDSRVITIQNKAGYIERIPYYVIVRVIELPSGGNDATLR